jgi:hypothetical protein
MGEREVRSRFGARIFKCLGLQKNACLALHLLTSCDLGKKKALEGEQTLEVLLAAVKNHLSSFFLCQSAVLALHNVITNDNKSTKLLLRSGGVAAASKVRELLPNEDTVQHAVQKLMIPLLNEMCTW